MAVYDSSPSIRTTAKSLDLSTIQVGFRVVFGLAEAGSGRTATVKNLKVGRRPR